MAYGSSNGNVGQAVVFSTTDFYHWEKGKGNF
jgi:hypothetical protein